MSDGSHRDRSADSAGDDDPFPTRAGDDPSAARPGNPSPARAAQLLLARVSEAAGRARLGRRQATYGAPFTGPGGWGAGPGGRGAAVGVVRRLLRVGGGPAGARARARLDLYERGLTVAGAGRIHVVRYDSTVVRRRRVLSPQGLARAYVLVDVDGERMVLRCGDFGHPEVWGPEIRRAVTDAQLPRALAALAEGARLAFGPVWVTREAVGSRGASLRWEQVRRIEVLNGSFGVRTAAGRWQVWGTVASGIPNLCVLQALAEHLAATAPHRRDDDKRN
ncbi:DUF6585 family protein [Streptomyces sp. NBC_00299]|uniref:DUF6585 family protein n=1 Tax=Streptomyces sp. NBC_00299 TaxID=2975705 RepID=UPI002E2C412E|nr:DUF6585 family protein [Streptomyces sp. NBC_00299]